MNYDHKFKRIMPIGLKYIQALHVTFEITKNLIKYDK